MKGFTLIELLVVVLIIGILATIALPQYELVVEKSRAAEAMVNAKAIQDAMQRHEQEFPGENVTNKSQIADVKLKGGTWNTEGTCFYTKNFLYALSGGEDSNLGVYRKKSPDCSNIGGDYLYYVSYYKPQNGTGVQICYTSNDDYEQICKLFTDL